MTRGRQTGGKAGFTLVEMMLAVVLASIVGLSVGSLLVFGNRALIRNTRMVEMQRDVSLAMGVISRGLLMAKIGLDPDSFSGDTLYFDDDKTTGVIWRKGQGTLNTIPDNIVLIHNDWDILEFDAEQHANGTWQVELQVEDPETRYRLVMFTSVLPRND